MKSIRIGNDIRIEWPIVLSGDVSKLQDLDLTVEVRPSAKIIDTHNYADETPDEDKDKRPVFIKTETTVMMNGGITCRPDIGDGKEHCRPRPCPPHPHRPVPPAPVRLPYHIEDNTLIAMWTADRQFATGDYDIILYAHKNEGGQAVCDQYRFVRLVSHTAQADAPDDSGIEAVIAMQPVTLELSGLSAYEVAVVNGFQGTEEEWLQSLKQPAIDAAEQAKKDLEQFKTETKAEVKQDITNLNSNTGVDDYPVFSASEAYSKGKVVNYNGKLYKFTADHAAGAWTGIDVEETDVVEAHLLEVRADIKLNSIRNIDIVWIDDSYYNETLSLISDDINNVCSSFLKLEKNKLYQLRISVFSDIYTGVKDSNGNIIQLFHRGVDELYNFSIMSLPNEDCTLYLSTLQKYKNEVILSEVNLDSLCEYINIQSGGGNIYNITNIFPNGGNGEGLYTLSQAINALPRSFIKEGTEIRFLDTASNRKSYIYSGGEISSASNWADLSNKLAITPKFSLENKYYDENLNETDFSSQLSFSKPILLQAGLKYDIFINKTTNSIYCGIKDNNGNIIWKTNSSCVKTICSKSDCYFLASCTQADNVYIISEKEKGTKVTTINGGYYNDNYSFISDENYLCYVIYVNPGEVWHIDMSVNGNLHNKVFAVSTELDKNKIYNNENGIYDILIEYGVNKLVINTLKGNYLSYYLSVPLNDSYTKLIDKEYKEYDLSNATKYPNQYWDETLTLQNLSNCNAYKIEVKKGDIYVIDTLLVADLCIGYKVNNISIKVYRGGDTSVDDFRFKKFIFNYDCTLCITEYNPVKVYKKVEVDEILNELKDTFIPYINYPSEIVEDKELGYYNNRGEVTTEYMPETYMHSLYKIVHTEGCNIRIYSDAVGITSNNSAIVYFDDEMNVLKQISASSLGITSPDNTKINYTDFIQGVYFIGISTRNDANSYGILESAVVSTDIDDTSINVPTSNISDLGNLDISYPEYDYNHIIVYGQSYAQGGGTVANTSNVDNTYCLGNTCSANTNKSTAELQVLGNAGGQIAIQCTKSLTMLYNRGRKDKASFIATNGGASGQQIENISKGTSYYTNLINEMTRIKQIADEESKSVGCVAIIFIQGESNYIANSGTGNYTDVKSEYKYLIKKLKEDIQNDAVSIYGQDAKPLFITYQTGYKWIRNNNSKLTITQAQVELGEELDDVILGCPSYQQTINSTQHPNGNGYAWIGELMAKHLYHAMCKYERYETPHPLNFSVKGNTITIGCYVPVPPLVIDTHTSEEVKNYGFEVLSNGEPINIDNIIITGNTIRINTSVDLSDSVVEVSYAGLNRNGEGNICASDNRYSSYQIYADDTSDTLLKYPVDINGRRIIGKKLPLQNWLCNFYKNIDFHFTKHILIIKTSDVNISNELVNTKDAEVTFSSSNTNIATINQSTGVITPLTNGHSVITASMSINGKTWTDDYLLEID